MRCWFNNEFVDTIVVHAHVCTILGEDLFGHKWLESVGGWEPNVTHIYECLGEGFASVLNALDGFGIAAAPSVGVTHRKGARYESADNAEENHEEHEDEHRATNDGNEVDYAIDGREVKCIGVGKVEM